jgi:hypothetical protein
MRSHGVANFPDPDNNGSIQIPSGSAIDKSSDAYRSAYGACRSLAPSRGLLRGPSGDCYPCSSSRRQLQQQMLAFTACMRSHGIHAFPDPTVANGRIHLRLEVGQRIDPNSPLVTAALATCRTKLSGEYGRNAGKLVAVRQASDVALSRHPTDRRVPRSRTPNDVSAGGTSRAHPARSPRRQRIIPR